MKDKSKKSIWNLFLFVMISGVLSVLQGSFFSFSFLGGKGVNILLSFVLADVYFRKENHLVNLFKAALTAFFIFSINTFSWPLVFSIVAFTVFFLKFLGGAIREKNIVIFFPLSLISFLFYYQAFEVVKFLKGGSFVFVVPQKIITVLAGTLLSVFFYLLYVRFFKKR